MFEDKETEAEREDLAVGTGEFLDSLNYPLKAQKYIFICALIDLIIFSAIFFLPRFVYNLPFENHLLIAIILFTLGFIMGNAAWRLAFPGRQEQTHIDSGVMSGYKYSTQQNNRWIIWLASAGTGVLNMLAALVIFKLT